MGAYKGETVKISETVSLYITYPVDNFDTFMTTICQLWNGISIPVLTVIGTSDLIDGVDDLKHYCTDGVMLNPTINFDLLPVNTPFVAFETADCPDDQSIADECLCVANAVAWAMINPEQILKDAEEELSFD